MYCPNCGSNNQSEVKFCTRCGTNLNVVSEALTGRTGPAVQVDERVAKVIKDYYKGRRSAITGLVLIPAAVKVIALLILFGLKPVAAFFIVSWMLIWGISALADGLGKWIASGGELRALGYQLPNRKRRKRSKRLLKPSATGEPLTTDYSTGPVSSPISMPASVTEQTTRTLEERARKQKQIQ